MRIRIQHRNRNLCIYNLTILKSIENKSNFKIIMHFFIKKITLLERGKKMLQNGIIFIFEKLCSQILHRGGRKQF